MKKVLTLIAIIIMISFSSCVSYNKNQTGRTIDKGNLECGMDIGHCGMSEETDEFFINFPALPLISTSMFFNYGILNNLDIGFEINLFTHFSGSIKYQYLGDKDSQFASSIGFSGGYIENDQFDVFSLHNYRFFLFNSIHSYDNRFAFFFSPTFLILNHSKGNPIYKNLAAPGYSIGFVYGEKNKINFGYNQYFNNENVYFYTNPSKIFNHSFNLGFSFVIKPKEFYTKSRFLFFL